MNKKIIFLITPALILAITHGTKIMGCQQQPDLTNLKFNAASPNPPHGNTLRVGYFRFNNTHLTMHYVPSPDKAAKSITIPLTPAQHKLLTMVLQGQHFYQHSYVQAKNKKENLIWFALPNNQKEL